MSHNVPKLSGDVFRAYDIRGTSPGQLSPTFAMLLGRAVGTRVRSEGGQYVVLGRDQRQSSEALRGALTVGLLRSGCTILDVGLCPTPMVSWAARRAHAYASVMITGSHCPNTHNGFKLTLRGESLTAEAIQTLRRQMELGCFVDAEGGVVRHLNLRSLYIHDMLSRLRSRGRRLRVVVDAGCGTAGVAAPALYRAMGHQVTDLYCTPSAQSTSHHADPTVDANLKDLVKLTRALKADVGIAYDGDGDRIGVVTPSGRIVRGDQLLALYAKQVLASQPGASVLCEVKCSPRLGQIVEEEGGRVVMCPTGHGPIKRRMKETGAPLAGEMSGHVFFADRYFGFDDAIYAGGRLLEILAQGEVGLDSMIEALEFWPSTPEIRVAVRDSEKFELAHEAIRLIKAGLDGDCQVIEVDGLRVEWPHGWGLLRPSNTEGVIVLRFEGRTQRALADIRDVFMQGLEQAGQARQLLENREAA